ncbi:transcriptional regulator GcvA [Corallococcus exercitus]|uniref:Transcriptional regulator GcvA n=1 Tax=Corallococcus exercitus TaxID=2316736 RepID=A0A3A8ITC5_9BACT|nr:transcriptional regulator GcvA [Corallococcus exercitus]NOK37810.1 transcriptional regulator GcvA [Corallococcus exercitus]RKG81551.1 transcriptional regulator GcvA [Corallococcus exercitus]
MSAPEHLNALRAFEAAARHESFSAAAAELHVTPAAVGQLVRSLEESLGTPLFHRGASGHKRLVLTEAAQRALPDIRAGFERLSAGVARLKDVSSTGVLTVTVSSAFAAKWLLPRLERFQAAWPELDVRLDASTELLDFAARGIDIGVRYGAGGWPGLTAEKLLDEEVFPVCSPALLRQGRRMRRPSDLDGLRLIHDRSVDARSGFATWDAWLEKAGAREVETKRGLRINNSAAVLQAAIDGQGVALARSIMARDDLSAGRLVRLFPEVEFASVLAYYVVYRPECATLPKVMAFREWLVREAVS